MIVVFFTVAATGSPPAGEDDGKKTHTSFSPLLFVISAEGGNDEQWSEAGIQLKCASGVAGHNRRLRRRKDVSNAIELIITFPLAGEDDGVGGFFLLRQCKMTNLQKR